MKSTFGANWNQRPDWASEITTIPPRAESARPNCMSRGLSRTAVVFDS